MTVNKILRSKIKQIVLLHISHSRKFEFWIKEESKKDSDFWVKLPKLDENSSSNINRFSDVRKAAEEEIRQTKKKRRLQNNDAQMTQDPNTNSHIRIEIT